jgi:hypothetical protein
MKRLFNAAVIVAGVIAGATYGLSPASAAPRCPFWGCVDVPAPLEPVSQGFSDFGGAVTDTLKANNPFVCHNPEGCDGGASGFDEPPSHPLVSFSYDGVTKYNCDGVIRTSSGFAGSTRVENNSGETLYVSWYDADGALGPSLAIDSGYHRTYSTKSNDALQISSDSGWCAAQFKIDSEDASITIYPNG